MIDIPNSFWSFSLSFYSETEVKKACLDLQERFDADVNMLLFLLYQAGQGKRLSEAEINRIDQLVHPWRSGIIRHIRAARNNLKQPNDHLTVDEKNTFKSQLMATELQAEKLQQSMLETLEIECIVAAPKTAAQLNLDAYAKMINCEQRDLATLLNAFENKYSLS